MPAGEVQLNVVPWLVNTCPFVPTVLNPVPPLAVGRVPVTPVVKGKPVAFVNVPLEGVPNAGVVMVGDDNVAEAIDGEIKCVFCCATFVPSLHTVIVLSAGMATPVPAAVVLAF